MIRDFGLNGDAGRVDGNRGCWRVKRERGVWQRGRTDYEVGKGTSSGCWGVVVGEGSEEALREKGVLAYCDSKGAQRRRFTR